MNETTAIEKDNRGSVMHVRFTRPDMLMPPHLRRASRELLTTVESARGCEVVVNLSNIDAFLASEAVGMFLAAHKALKRGGGSLRLQGVTPHLREVFAVTRLDEVIAVDLA